MKESLHYLLMANHLLFQKTLLTGIKDTELTSGQPKVLDYLRDHDGTVQKDIALACHIEPATLTSVLAGMEGKGLITRKPLNGNRRSLYVYLTDSGKELAMRVDAEFDTIEKKALSGFTPSEEAQLNALLSRIKNNMTMEGEKSNDKN